MIELSDNIKPSNEEIKAIHQQYKRDISMWQRIQFEYMKIHVPIYFLNKSTGKLKMHPIENEDFLNAGIEIEKITDFYRQKYSPFFSMISD